MLVDFYHLTAAPLERVLPRICERLIEGGERLLIVAEEGLLAQLDAQLWSYASDGFLPHGRSGGPRAEQQPILLSSSSEPVNGARNIAMADGLWRDEALSFSRAFFFFDQSRVGDARELWRRLKTLSEIESRYWQQDGNGKWSQRG